MRGMLRTIDRRPHIARDIELGSKLARMQGSPISPEQVAKIFERAKLKYVLVGAHAMNGYTGHPRATEDVDVIAQFPKKASKALANAFPHLIIEDTPVVVRFRDADRVAIDLMKPTGLPLWPALMKESREVVIAKQKVRVPVLEGVLAAKFAAMASPLRRMADRMIDAGDFMRVVDANEHVDLSLLARLGELVYVGGGKDVLKHVENARAGRQLEI